MTNQLDEAARLLERCATFINTPFPKGAFIRQRQDGNSKDTDTLNNYEAQALTLVKEVYAFLDGGHTPQADAAQEHWASYIGEDADGTTTATVICIQPDGGHHLVAKCYRPAYAEVIVADHNSRPATVQPDENEQVAYG